MAPHARTEARAALRKEAADAGINETGKYDEWLEALALGLRDDLRNAHAALRVAGRLTTDARIEDLCRDAIGGGEYEGDSLRAAIDAAITENARYELEEARR